MLHICGWSGGKDSCASIILAKEHGIPLDKIVFSEVMYDRKNNISGEHPWHMDFMKNKAIPLFRSWGYEVVILHADTDYLDLFHHIIDSPRAHTEHVGKKFGFPLTGLCSIKRDLKVKPMQQYLKSLNEPYIQYLGICADEPLRLRSMEKKQNAYSILAEFGYTQEMTRAKCEEYGLLSPVYELTDRSGCWFCPFAKVEEHRELKRSAPDLWASFISLEQESDLAYSKWNVYDTTLAERDVLLL